jgi:DNA-binding SARP family transcriptional activator
MERENWEAAVGALQQAVASYEEQQQEKEGTAAWLALAAASRQIEQEADADAALQRAMDLATPPIPHSLVVACREEREFLATMAEEGRASPGMEALLAEVEQFEENLPGLRRLMRSKMAAVPFAPPQLRIQLLGETQVSIGGETVTRSDWQTPMAPSLLYLLLAHADGLTKEEIGLYLWPDHSPGRLKVNFQKTIYRLRRAVASDVVVYDEETKQYRFNRELDYTCDVESFRLHLMEARTATTAEERKTAYRAALELYRGPYLADDDEIWAESTREALAEAYREAALDLAELYLEEDSYTHVLKLCRRLLSEDPCLEEAHRLAMRAHAGRGNMAGVVRQYQRCERALEEEIRVAPSPHTMELYNHLTGTA